MGRRDSYRRVFAFLTVAVVGSLLAGCGGNGGGGDGSAVESADSTPPEITNAVATGATSILVSFSEPMDETTGDAGRYALEPGNVVTDAELNRFKTQVRLTTLALTPGRAYTLSAPTVMDESGNMVDPEASSRTVVYNGSGDGSDTTAPRLTSAVATSATTILVSFSESMNESIGDPARYTLAPGGFVSGAVVSQFRSQALLTTSTLTPGLTYTVSAAAVADGSGNVLDPAADSASVVFGAVDERAPQLLGATTVDQTTIKLTFSEPLSDMAFDPARYAIVPPVQILSAQLSADRTEVTLNTAPMQLGQEYYITIGGITDRAGNPLPVMTQPARISDQEPTGGAEELPRVVGAASTSNTTIVIKFSKGMSDTALNPANYFVELQPDVGVLTLASRCQTSRYLCASGNLLLKTCTGSSPERLCQSASDCSPGVTCEVACTSGCTGARFVDGGRTEVEIQTISQNDGVYTITATGTTDLGGRPLAPKQVVAGAMVDPTTAEFRGTGPVADGGIDGNAGVDSDGDAMPDTDEQSGWDIVVRMQNGESVPQHVTANPLYPDTDGDGLIDSLEFSVNSNPRSNDSDGDGLTDNDEYNIVYSDPTSQDSDGDGMSDFLEVETFKTNAILNDSDGDGFSDGEELFEMNRDPRVADLPRHQISVGAVRLQIDERFTYTDENGDTITETSSTDTTLTNTSTSTESKFSQDVGHFLIGADAGLDSCQTDKACDLTYEPLDRLVVMGHAETGGEFTRATTFEDANAAERAFATSIEKARELSKSSAVTREIVGARIDVEVNLQNVSDVALTLSNVEITVVATDSQDPQKFVPVATLVPNSLLVTGAPAAFNLGPFQTRGPVLFSNRDVFPNLVEDLLRAPRALMFKVSNFDVSTEDGRNFAYGFQTVRDRTTAVVIDFGNGTVRQSQAITAGVLSRPRDEKRCSPGGDHPDEPCSSDDDCGTSRPCEGGKIIGGFADFPGTGRLRGIPLDFVLKDILGMRKNATEPDGILAGPDGAVHSIAAGDDVQLIPVGTIGVPEDAVVIGAGENGVLDTGARRDDVVDKVTGYETSVTCDGDTPSVITAGANRQGETVPRETGSGNDDVFTMTLPVVVTAGPDGFISTIPGGDDAFVGPGVPCQTDSDCRPGGGTVGLCAGPETVVRIENRRRGAFRGRTWVMLLPDQSQFQTDFGQVQMRAGETLALAYVQDLDRDGLISQEEFLHGSSDFSSDTDDDLIGDFSEVRVGWEVGVVGQPLRRVFPDPADPDSDHDGLSDREEQDLRPVQCKADMSLCTDVTLHRTDPRRRDTDDDRVSDFDEVFSYPTGRGILDPANVIIAGPNRTADSVACPHSHCSDDVAQHCAHDGDCVSRECVLIDPGCDDVQVVPAGTGGLQEETVVVAPGADGVFNTSLRLLRRGDDVIITNACSSDVTCLPNGNGRADTVAVGDDVPVVGIGEAVEDGAGQCADGSEFPLCAVIRPGPDGELVSQAGGDDVVVLSGQRVEKTDPLNPDTDLDEVSDGIEQTLGSSPNDSGDTGSPADADQDGLTDNQETKLGWAVTFYDDSGTAQMLPTVFSNRNISDTDHDGLPDYAERYMPCARDLNAACSTNPRSADTDGDGLSDYDELSAEQFARLQVFNNFFNGFRVDGSASRKYGTDPSRVDTDEDGLADDFELSEGWTVVLSDGSLRQVLSDPTKKDSDADGLDDGEERTHKTDPRDPDTDGDERLDGQEIDAKADPLVQDLAVRLVFREILVDVISDEEEHDDGSEFAWWFVLRISGKPPVLISDARRFGYDDALPNSDLFLGGLANGGGHCSRLAAVGCNNHAQCGDLGPCVPLPPLAAGQIGYCPEVECQDNNQCGSGGVCALDKGVGYCARRTCSTDVDCGTSGPCTPVPVLAGTTGYCAAAPRYQARCGGVFSNPQHGNELECGTAGPCVNECHIVRLASFDQNHANLALDVPPNGRLDKTDPPDVADYTFLLHKGESFVVEGMLAELDLAPPDCGRAPTFIPMSFESECYSRFHKTYNYSELERGDRGDTADFSDGDGTMGNVTCAWQVRYSVQVR